MSFSLILRQVSVTKSFRTRLQSIQIRSAFPATSNHTTPPYKHHTTHVLSTSTLTKLKKFLQIYSIKNFKNVKRNTV